MAPNHHGCSAAFFVGALALLLLSTGFCSWNLVPILGLLANSHNSSSPGATFIGLELRAASHVQKVALPFGSPEALRLGSLNDIATGQRDKVKRDLW